MFAYTDTTPILRFRQWSLRRAYKNCRVIISNALPFASWETWEENNTPHNEDGKDLGRDCLKEQFYEDIYL